VQSREHTHTIGTKRVLVSNAVLNPLALGTSSRTHLLAAPDAAYVASVAQEKTLARWCLSNVSGKAQSKFSNRQVLICFASEMFDDEMKVAAITYPPQE